MPRRSKIVPFLLPKPEVSNDLQEWYNYFYGSKTTEMDLQFQSVKSYMRYFYGFLQKEQINGRCYDFLKIPNTMGKINKSKFLKKIKEKSLKKSKKESRETEIDLLNRQLMNLGVQPVELKNESEHSQSTNDSAEYQKNRFFKTSRFERITSMVERSQIDLYMENNIKMNSSISVEDFDFGQNTDTGIKPDFNNCRQLLRSESEISSLDYQSRSPPPLLQPSSLGREHQIALRKIKNEMGILTLTDIERQNEDTQNSTGGEAPDGNNSFERFSVVEKSQFDLYMENNIILNSSIKVEDVDFDDEQIMDADQRIEQDYLNNWDLNQLLGSESYEISVPHDCQSPPPLSQPCLGSDHHIAQGNNEMSSLKMPSSGFQNEGDSQNSTVGEAPMSFDCDGIISENDQESDEIDMKLKFKENNIILNPSISIEDVDNEQIMDTENIIESDYYNWARRHFLGSESEISAPHDCHSPPPLLQPSSLGSDHQIGKDTGRQNEDSQNSTVGEAPMSFDSDVNNGISENDKIISESDGNNGTISESNQESYKNYFSSSPDGSESWNIEIPQWYSN